MTSVTHRELSGRCGAGGRRRRRAPGPEHPGGRLAQIGKVAERVGLRIRTIRHYEELGLIGSAAHSEGGFRLYPEVVTVSGRPADGRRRAACGGRRVRRKQHPDLASQQEAGRYGG